jgi:hypothetical protein
MNDVLALWMIVTAIAFVLSLASWLAGRGSYYSDQQVYALAVLTCWAWPLWLVVGIPWLLLALICDALGRGEG